MPEDMDLTELNLLAEKLASLEPVQEAAFEGLVRMDLDKGTMELPLCRLIDLANSADCCHVAPGVGTAEQEKCNRGVQEQIAMQPLAERPEWRRAESSPPKAM